MEIKEAIAKLRNWQDDYTEVLSDVSAKTENEYSESLLNEIKIELAINGLCISALEKQVPKSPILDNPSKMRYVQTYTCPCCENGFSGTISEYCYHCGQALLWESEATK